MRPLKALRNLVFFGCSMSAVLSGGHRPPGAPPPTARRASARRARSVERRGGDGGADGCSSVLALALDRTADRAAGRLDLARGDALGFHRLQPIGAEVQIGAALGEPVDAALEGLAELGFLRLQHVSSP